LTTAVPKPHRRDAVNQQVQEVLGALEHRVSEMATGLSGAEMGIHPASPEASAEPDGSTHSTEDS
jgi:hypothetical protein